MNTGSVIIGNHASFFHDAAAFTIPSAGTAGRASKPGATDPVWVDLGILSDIGVTHARDEREIYAPTPGQLRLYDVIETKRKMSFKMACEEMSPLAFELL